MIKTIILLLLIVPLYSNSQDCSVLENALKSGNLIDIEKYIEGNAKICPSVIGEIYLRKGRNDLAQEYFEKALKIAKDKTAEKASVLNSLGLVFWNTGNTQKAQNYIQQGLDIRKSLFGQDHEFTAASYNDLGLVISSNNPDEALDYYETAYKIYKNIYGEGNEKTIQALINSGITYRQLTYYGDASVNFESALSLWKKLYPEGHPNEAFILTNIGRAKQLTNDLEGARAFYEKALIIYIKFYGNKHPEVASTLNLIGNIYNIQGQFDFALSYYQKALIANTNRFKSDDLNNNPSADDYLNSNTLLNTLYYKSKAFSDLHYNKTLKFNDLKSSLTTLQSCDSLIDNIRQLRTNEADKLALGQLANTVYETGVELCKGMGDVAVKKDAYYELSFYFAEKSKSAVLLEAISDANAKSFAGLSPEDLASEKNLKSEITFYENALIAEKNIDVKKTFQNKLLELRNEYQKFISQLETKYPEYYDLKYSQKQPSISQIQSKLTSGQIMLSYFLTSISKRIYIYEITSDNYKINSNPQSELFNRFISGYRNSIYFKDAETYTRTAKSLYDQLIPKRLNKNTTQLIIIPSGRLSTIPFEAFLSDTPKNSNDYTSFPFLINNYDISYYYSSTLFYQQKTYNNEGGTALLCAPVSFTQLPDLPGTELEITALEKIFSNNGVVFKSLIKENATEQGIKQPVNTNYKYLHFATHGIVDEINPDKSRIFLKAKDNEDGNLYSGEIYNLNLSSDLVTLSACETGLGKLSEGEGVIGLSRALLYAGANNIIVSLWKVSDASTTDLMIDFYTNNTSASYANPLHLAKLNLIKSERYSEPYYWAPFILIGR